MREYYLHRKRESVVVGGGIVLARSAHYSSKDVNEFFHLQNLGNNSLDMRNISLESLLSCD